MYSLLKDSEKMSGKKHTANNGSLFPVKLCSITVPHKKHDRHSQDWPQLFGF